MKFIKILAVGICASLAMTAVFRVSKTVSLFSQVRVATNSNIKTQAERKTASMTTGTKKSLVIDITDQTIQELELQDLSDENYDSDSSTFVKSSTEATVSLEPMTMTKESILKEAELALKMGAIQESQKSEFIRQQMSILASQEHVENEQMSEVLFEDENATSPNENGANE